MKTIAYHGTPARDIEEFCPSFMGAGEGNQSFGWGFYFAGHHETAEHYRKMLTGSQPEDMKALEQATRFRSQSFELLRTQKDVPLAYELITRAEMIENRVGDVYMVSLPGEHLMIDWDAPMVEQPEHVKEVLYERLYEYGNGDHDTPEDEMLAQILDDFEEDRTLLGRDLYEKLAYGLGGFVRNTYNIEPNPQRASQFLSRLGIAGIAYLDGNSRHAGAGTKNYVAFDVRDIEVLGSFYSTHGLRRVKPPITPTRSRAMSL